MQITNVSLATGFYGLSNVKPAGAKKAAKSLMGAETDFSKYAYSTPTGETAKETPQKVQQVSKPNYYPFGNPTNIDAAHSSDIDKVDKADLNDKSHNFLSVSMMTGK